jgi:hypothetical protein
MLMLMLMLMLLLLHTVYTAIKITYEVFRICFSSKGFSTKIRIEDSAGGSCYGLLINSTLPPMPPPLPDGSDPETATVSRPQEFGSQPTTTNSTTIVTAAAHLHPHPRGTGCLSGTAAGLDGTVQACGARVQQLRVRPGAEHGRMRPPPTSTPTASMRRRSNGAQPTYRTHIAPQLPVSCIKQPLRTMGV